MINIKKKGFIYKTLILTLATIFSYSVTNSIVVSNITGIDELGSIAFAKKEVKAKLKKEGITLDTALDNMRKQHIMYAEMTKDKLEERYYEEYLADEFDKFKMDPKSTKTNTENKSLFQRIIDFIFGVLSEYRPRQLNKLFDGIDSGKYKNTSIQENRFTKSFISFL